jgi:hypothetical protein
VDDDDESPDARVVGPEWAVGARRQPGRAAYVDALRAHDGRGAGRRDEGAEDGHGEEDARGTTNGSGASDGEPEHWLLQRDDDGSVPVSARSREG